MEEQALSNEVLYNLRPSSTATTTEKQKVAIHDVAFCYKVEIDERYRRRVVLENERGEGVADKQRLPPRRQRRRRNFFTTTAKEGSELDSGDVLLEKQLDNLDTHWLLCSESNHARSQQQEEQTHTQQQQKQQNKIFGRSCSSDCCSCNCSCGSGKNINLDFLKYLRQKLYLIAGDANGRLSLFDLDIRREIKSHPKIHPQQRSHPSFSQQEQQRQQRPTSTTTACSEGAAVGAGILSIHVQNRVFHSTKFHDAISRSALDNKFLESDSNAHGSSSSTINNNFSSWIRKKLLQSMITTTTKKNSSSVIRSGSESVRSVGSITTPGQLKKLQFEFVQTLVRNFFNFLETVDVLVQYVDGRVGLFSNSGDLIPQITIQTGGLPGFTKLLCLDFDLIPDIADDDMKNIMNVWNKTQREETGEIEETGKTRTKETELRTTTSTEEKTEQKKMNNIGSLESDNLNNDLFFVAPTLGVCGQMDSSTSGLGLFCVAGRDRRVVDTGAVAGIHSCRDSSESEKSPTTTKTNNSQQQTASFLKAIFFWENGQQQEKLGLCLGITAMPNVANKTKREEKNDFNNKDSVVGNASENFCKTTTRKVIQFMALYESGGVCIWEFNLKLERKNNKVLWSENKCGGAVTHVKHPIAFVSDARAFFFGGVNEKGRFLDKNSFTTTTQTGFVGSGSNCFVGGADQSGDMPQPREQKQEQQHEQKKQEQQREPKTTTKIKTKTNKTANSSTTTQSLYCSLVTSTNSTPYFWACSRGGKLRIVKLKEQEIVAVAEKERPNPEGSSTTTTTATNCDHSNKTNT